MSTFSGICEEFVMLEKLFTLGFFWRSFVANSLAMPLFETGLSNFQKSSSKQWNEAICFVKGVIKPKE